MQASHFGSSRMKVSDLSTPAPASMPVRGKGPCSFSSSSRVRGLLQRIAASSAFDSAVVIMEEAISHSNA